MVHCTQYPKELPTLVGKNVVVNAGAILHGCVLEDGSLVGEGAQVMDGAKVGKGAMVAPGAFVGIGKSVPAGQLWAGVPARYVRDVSEAETSKIAAAALENATLAAEHAQENAKTWQVGYLCTSHLRKLLLSCAVTTVTHRGCCADRCRACTGGGGGAVRARATGGPQRAVLPQAQPGGTRGTALSVCLAYSFLFAI
jgi:hypothetical protein